MKAHFGSSRKTYLIGKYAIKVPTAHISRKHFLRGMLANIIEKDMVKCTTAKVTKIHYCGFFGLIQIAERLNPIEDKDMFKFYEDLTTLCDKEPGRYDFYHHDLQAANWGYNDEGELIKLDFASPFMDDL